MPEKAGKPSLWGINPLTNNRAKATVKQKNGTSPLLKRVTDGLPYNQPHLFLPNLILLPKSQKYEDNLPILFNNFLRI